MKKAKAAPAKRRNAEARAAWRLGHRVEKNPKAYSRKPKHKNPHREDGGFSLSLLRDVPAIRSGFLHKTRARPLSPDISSRFLECAALSSSARTAA